MPFIITVVLPDATATITPVKVYRFVINSSHEIVTLTSNKSTIAIAR